MSIFSVIFEKRTVVGGGNLTDNSDFWYSIGGVPSASGIPVNKNNSMRVSMVMTCVTLRANTLAQFPLKVKKKTGNITEDAVDHPLYEILKLRPNPEMTSFSWRQAGQGNIDTTGCEYNWIERNRRGVKALWPLAPESVEAVRANGDDVKNLKLGKNDKIIYVVSIGGTQYRIPARDMLKFIGFTFDGRTGESVISFASNIIGNRMSLDNFQGKWMEKGLHISGTMEHPNTLGDNKEDFLKALTARYAGSTNAGRPMVLENGMKYNQIKVSLADQQFVEQAELTSLEIARMFQVPPSRVGIPGVNESNASLEQENMRFLDTTIMPIAVAREQAMDFQLLTEQERKDGYFIKHNFDALLRPDAKTRAEIDQIYWGMGEPLNDIRERDDKNPINGGDKSYTPLNYATDEEREEDPENTEVIEVEENDRRESRSIASRDKIQKRWAPVIEAVADRLVRYEANSVERQANKELRNQRGIITRDFPAFDRWLEDFYIDFAKRVKKELGSTMAEYMRSIADEVQKEANSTVSDAEIDVQINEYIDGMANQWAGASAGQLRKLMEDNPDDFEKVVERAEEWKEKRTKKVTERQSSGGSNSIATFIITSVGLSAMWNIRGAQTCKFCRTLNGKKIKRGGNFAGLAGVDPGDGDQALIPNGITTYPPLHSGCDCYISIG